MIQILHTGDFQLGFAQYGLVERLNDFNRAARAALDAAITRHRPGETTTIVVLAGDLFEVPEPPASAVNSLRDAVHACQAVGIKVLGVLGNHDAGDDETGGWLRACDIHNLEREVYHAPDNTPIGGLNFRHPDLFYAELASYLQRQPPLRVLVLHQCLSEFAAFETPLTLAETQKIIDASPSAVSCELVLLGDIHASMQRRVGGRTYAYCGATEWNSMNEPAHKTVSFWTATAAPTGFRQEIAALDTRQVVVQDITSDAELDQLRATLAQDRDKKRLYYVVYDQKIPGIRAELRTLLSGYVSRSSPKPTGKGLTADMLVRGAEKTSARVTASEALVQVLHAAFPDTGDVPDPRKTLITEMLNDPKNVELIATKYARARGVTLQGAVAQ